MQEKREIIKKEIRNKVFFIIFYPTPKYVINLLTLYKKSCIIKSVKNKIFLLFTIFFFISCSTTTNIEQNSSPLTIENKTPKEKLQFEDWKYKGFGNKIPQWSIYAYNNDIESLTTYIDNLTDAKEIKTKEQFFSRWVLKESLGKCVGTGLKGRIKEIPSTEGLFNYMGESFSSKSIKYEDYMVGVCVKKNEEISIIRIEVESI